MREFDVYGSSNGAWKLAYQQFRAQQISGISGHVTAGTVTDAFFKGIYNIYLTKTFNENHREYYALKDGENVTKLINGLPDDALLLAVHNLAGINFFGSAAGAFKLVQGELIAHQVPGVTWPVRRIVLGGSARPDDVQFLPE